MTFFSGTDVNTLKEEGNSTNHFLSLIVNNEGTYTARITRKIHTEGTAKVTTVLTETIKYNTFENKEVILSDNKESEETKEENSSTDVLEYYNLNIIKETEDNNFDELSSRIESLRKAKVAKTAKKFNWDSLDSHTSSVYYDGYYDDYYSPKKVNDYSPKQLNLFTDKKEDITKAEVETEEIIDEAIVKNLSTQLLCSSLIVNSEKLDLKAWVKKMDSLYEKRFKSNKDLSENKTLKNWISILVEYIVTEQDMANLSEEYSEEDRFTLYAEYIYFYLKDLPWSKVKGMFMEELETYIEEMYEDIK